jgi:hypothetical protein
MLALNEIIVLFSNDEFFNCGPRLTHDASHRIEKPDHLIDAIFCPGQLMPSFEIPNDVGSHNAAYRIEVTPHIAVEKPVDNFLVCHITMHLIFEYSVSSEYKNNSPANMAIFSALEQGLLSCG